MTTQHERDEARRSKVPNLTHVTDVAEIEGLTAMHVVEGYVWCSKHGCVHSDTLNPEGYAQIETTVPQDFCTAEDHDAIFADTERHVQPRGAGQPLPPGRRIIPEPVRQVPVPLSVRRHTPESRDIFWKNLFNALPVDMDEEMRSKITDELIEMAISQGNLLRRKRIIDKLMVAAEEMEDLDQAHRKPWSERLERWGAIMEDAAEEIRSIM
jgi:hypothetical protein